jgi:hypothetical protein
MWAIANRFVMKPYTIGCRQKWHRQSLIALATNGRSSGRKGWKGDRENCASAIAFVT